MPTAKRNEEIRRLVRKGETYKAIACRYGISVARVGQIVRNGTDEWTRRADYSDPEYVAYSKFLWRCVVQIEFRLAECFELIGQMAEARTEFSAQRTELAVLGGEVIVNQTQVAADDGEAAVA